MLANTSRKQKDMKYKNCKRRGETILTCCILRNIKNNQLKHYYKQDNSVRISIHTCGKSSGDNKK